jgi:nicotinamidase-related amidase
MNPVKRTALLICDLQRRSVPHLVNQPTIIRNVNKLIHMKQYIPAFTFSAISEFIPHNLGKTSDDIDTGNIDLIYEKDTYSMATTQLLPHLCELGVNTVILTGMEIQWCINKSVSDFHALSYDVIVPVDAVGNQEADNTYVFEHLKNNGAQLSTTDALLCSYFTSSNEPAAKEYLKLVKRQKFNL